MKNIVKSLTLALALLAPTNGFAMERAAGTGGTPIHLEEDEGTGTRPTPENRGILHNLANRQVEIEVPRMDTQCKVYIAELITNHSKKIFACLVAAIGFAAHWYLQQATNT